MASTKITLKILPFKNPSGSIAYRVSGMILGTRVQKNFPTREQAEGFMNGALRTANQADLSYRERLTSTTFAMDEILRDAKAAYRLPQRRAPGTTLYAALTFVKARAEATCARRAGRRAQRHYGGAAAGARRRAASAS